MEIHLNLMDFKDRIRLIRRLRGLSKAELAKKCNISYNYVHKIEEGEKANPSMNVLKKMAEVLNIDIGELFKDLKTGYKTKEKKPCNSTNT